MGSTLWRLRNIQKVCFREIFSKNQTFLKIFLFFEKFVELFFWKIFLLLKKFVSEPIFFASYHSALLTLFLFVYLHFPSMQVWASLHVCLCELHINNFCLLIRVNVTLWLFFIVLLPWLRISCATLLSKRHKTGKKFEKKSVYIFN